MDNPQPPSATEKWGFPTWHATNSCPLIWQTKQGRFDDSTSFSDDDFDIYYPEVGGLILAAQEYGEFDPKIAEVYKLDARESILIRDVGYFVETGRSKFKD